MTEALQDRIETLEDALRRIQDWAGAYPIEVFPEPTQDELKRAHETLKAAGLGGINRFSAFAMRRVVKGVGDIARAALEAAAGAPAEGGR